MLGALIAAVVCLAFAAFTGHIWEDYFITFRASVNLATGNGLVFQPGERVHTFTSPLGTLLPALFALGGGESAAIRALWGLRIVSAFAVGGAVWMAVRAFQRDRLASFAMAAATGAWVLDPKIVDFSMNGMETGFVVLFVTLAWFAFTAGARIWPCAFGLAGLQWTRPDGCVFFGAIATAWLIIGHSPVWPSWRGRFMLALRATGLGLALYLPWFVFSWIYYGSPVPHTILAKAQHHSISMLADKMVHYPWRLIFGDVTLHDLYMPAYFSLGGWPASLSWAVRFLAAGAAVAWAWPRVPTPGRVASAALFLGGFYVAYIPPSPWYYPGWQTLGWITWAYLLHAIWSLRPRATWASALPQTVTRITVALMLVLQAGLLVCVAWQMRSQQMLIENDHRREIGRWLAQNAKAGDTVFLECLGYIGYYSGLKMLDYPGLSSPEVVAARRAGHTTWAQLIEVLRPNWIVLRPGEAVTIFGESPHLRSRYSFVRAFDTQAAIDALPLLPGRGYLNYDAAFLVYRLPPAGR